MRIGFTGTRRGMTPKQRVEVYRLLRTLGGDELHHGDCLGADVEAHDLAKLLGMNIVVHPPLDPKLRAYCAVAVTRLPKPYLERNRDIVHDTDVLVATPHGPEIKRSGTWATVRHARRLGRTVYIVEP